MTRERADKLLVTRGFFESRTSARAAIEAGRVSAGGVAVSKPSQMLGEDVPIKASAAHDYVSRGGLKLAHALDVFGLSVEGQICADLGASAGGFTDVLLRRGARRVTAIDIGRGQFHPRLRGDDRVRVYEGLDVRAVTKAHIGADVRLLVTDLSFIGLEKALGSALELAGAGTQIAGLFKPQFQVGRKHVGKGGIVTDMAASDAAAARFECWMDEQGWPLREWTASPISGGDGNAERLFFAVKL